MGKKWVTVFLAISVLLLFRSGAHAESHQIIVSAAISLKNAFEELGRLFETTHKGKKVCLNFGASGDLVTQIEGGAPVDVFASAAEEDMDEIERKGFVSARSRMNFASNSVVLVVPSKAAGSVRSFEDLASASVGRIAIGNPKVVPAGKYAEDVFRHYKLLPDIKDKLILTGNVRQALDYAGRREVDAAVVYRTDAMARAKDVRIAAVAPEASHAKVIYPIAVIKGKGDETSAKEFIALVVSPEGRKILAKFGFKEEKK